MRFTAAPKKWATGALLALTLIMGGGNLGASWIEVHNATAQQAHVQQLQREAGAVLGRKLCNTFGALAVLKPPPGDPVKNPSRAYEQQLHATLDQLGVDLGCPRSGR